MLAVANHRAPVPHGGPRGMQGGRSVKGQRIADNRAAYKAAKRQKAKQRDEQQRIIVHRMIRRLYMGKEPSHFLCYDYRYWQARRCGWDLLSKEFALDAAGKPCDPWDGEVWDWWRSIHPQQREYIADHSLVRNVFRARIH